MARQQLMHCSFCGKSQKAVARLIAGPSVYICDECVALCNAILDEHKDSDEKRVAVRDFSDMSIADLLRNLSGAATVTQSVDRHFKATVDELRGRGQTWAQIGEALGISRQAAWERFSNED